MTATWTQVSTTQTPSWVVMGGDLGLEAGGHLLLESAGRVLLEDQVFADPNWVVVSTA